MDDQLLQILGDIQSGTLSLAEASQRIRDSWKTTAPTAEAVVDIDRASRCGYPEVVYCPNKRPDDVVAIFEKLDAAGQDCLATRADADHREALRQAFPSAHINDRARTVSIIDETRPTIGRVAVVTAGTGDRAVADEAVETLRWMRCDQELIVDVGVAGPHRLPPHVDRLRQADVVIVVAGMEGALPSVVGGWVDSPVVAVPTSVGYGAHLGGIAPLLGMLNSCAANVTVVNIDAGFKAAYVAGLIAQKIGRARQ